MKNPKLDLNKEKKVLSSRAIAKGIVTQSQLEECLKEQRKSSPRKPLGAIMLEHGLLNDEDLVKLLPDHPEFIQAAKQELTSDDIIPTPILTDAMKNDRIINEESIIEDMTLQEEQEMEKKLGLPDLEKKWGKISDLDARWVKTGPGSYELEFDKEKFFSIPLKELMREAFSINYTPPPKQPYTPKEEQDSQSE